MSLQGTAIRACIAAPFPAPSRAPVEARMQAEAGTRDRSPARPNLFHCSPVPFASVAHEPWLIPMDSPPDHNPAAGPPGERSPKQVLARGVAWMTAARFGVQALGILSTIVLARLLTPADFGLVALAMTLVGLLDTLSHFGFEMPLIHKVDATREDYDTAWTLNILIATIISALIVLLAPWAAQYYKEPRIPQILYFVAAGYFILSFQNIGTVQFRKQLDFRRDFSLQIAQKISALAVTIPFAFALRSYWALIAGMVAGNLAAAAVSYLLLPYRPRLCLRSWRELLSFSKWLQLTGMMTYLRDQGYILVMGRLVDVRAVGLFSLANEIATMPSTTLVAPLNRAVFPGFARLSHDAVQLRDSYKSMLGLVALVALPAAVGVAAVATLIVPVALGPQWQASAPLVTLLALAGATRSLTASTVSLQYATGQPQLQTLTVGIQAFTLLPLVAGGVLNFGVYGAACAYLLHSVLVFLPVSYWILLRHTPIRFSDAAEPVWRPLLASALMFAITKPIADAWTVPNAWVALPRLVALATLGALIYAVGIAILWWLSGRPEGTEKALLRYAHPKFLRMIASCRL